MAERCHDIGVVGAGLAGSTLALALARAGFDVVLLDRTPPETRAAPEFDGRAYAIALGSARLLGALGLWAGLEPLAQPIADIRVGEGAGSPVLLHFDPRATAEGRVAWILEDHHLRATLIEAVAVSPVQEIPAGEITGVERGPGAAEITLGSGERVRARLVIAADGRRSALAQAAGIGAIGWSYAQTGLVAAIHHERPHHGEAHQSFFPGGPFAVLPMTGNRSSIVWSERRDVAERLMRLGDDGYSAELARRIGPRLGAIRLIGRRRAYPLALSVAEALVAPRLALLGDAAHGVHPIAGQGLNMGVRDVAALTEVLVAAARLGADIGSETVLRRYERWRRFDAGAFALGMDALNRLFSNGIGPLSVLRQAGLAAVDASGPAKRALMREASGQAGEVPRLLTGVMP